MKLINKTIWTGAALGGVLFTVGCDVPRGAVVTSSPSAGLVGSNGSGVADSNPILQVLPNVNASQAPENVKPGTRLIYRWSAAKVPGQGYDWKEDVNGDMVETRTGKRFTAYQKQGKGGAGYAEVTVAGFDGDATGLETLSYGFELSQAPNFLSESGSDGLSGLGDGYWAPVDALKSLPTSVGTQTEVMRMPYKLPTGDVDSIWIKANGERVTETHVYDPSSGLLIHSSSARADDASPVHGPNETNTGDTELTGTTLVKIEQLNIPWANDPEPAWTQSAHQLVFEGTKITGVGLPVTVKSTERATYEVTGRHNGWTDLQATLEDQMQGYPKGTSSVKLVTGPHELGPMWIAPEALARLQAGQVIDNDSLSQVVTKVDGRANGPSGEALVISQSNGNGRMERSYDLKTGCVVAVHWTDLSLHLEGQLTLTSSS